MRQKTNFRGKLPYVKNTLSSFSTNTLKKSVVPQATVDEVKVPAMTSSNQIVESATIRNEVLKARSYLVPLLINFLTVIIIF